METGIRANNNLGSSLVKIASVYMMAGVSMGLYVAMAKQYALATVHSHLLLLGWATMAIAGLVYFAAPDCATSRLARAHFWLHNAGLPVMMASLAVYEFGNAQAEILVGIGSMIVAVSLLLFTINLFRRCRLG